jgi:hypothetical protein
VVDTIKRLNAKDCFDYFVNNFDSVYQNESTYRNNATLDPEITNNILYLNLKDHYVRNILDNSDYQSFDVRFSRDSEAVVDFIVATFSDLTTEIEVSVEINRDDTPEMIEELFKNGLQTLKETFASEVYEMKSENH